MSYVFIATLGNSIIAVSSAKTRALAVKEFDHYAIPYDKIIVHYTLTTLKG